jgi:hypothetical protein
VIPPNPRRRYTHVYAFRFNRRPSLGRHNIVRRVF